MTFSEENYLKTIFHLTTFLDTEISTNAIAEKMETKASSVTDKISFSYNLGAEWDGFTAEPTFIYTTTAGYAISKKWGAFIEVFGFAPQENRANHLADAGFTYLISDNFMVDLSGGFGITSNAPNHFFSVGFSFRL